MSDQQTSVPGDADGWRTLIERHVRTAAGSEGTAVASGQVDCDSILLAEVLVSVEEESGVTIPMDERTARALRSVNSLAELLCGLVETGT